MSIHVTERPVSITPFEWKYWPALWELRARQLADAGVEVELYAGPPDLSSPYERDYHRIERVCLRGAGSLWLAWLGNTPVGHVAGQDWGGVVELRRMYVRVEYRRRGVGTRLVRTLIQHCVANGAEAIEVWTGKDGPGRRLYEKVGFRQTGGPGEEFRDKEVPCAYSPSDDEIRMRLDLR